METTLPTGNNNNPVPTSQVETKKESQKNAVRRLVREAAEAKGITLDDNLKTLLKTKKKELNDSDRELVKTIKKTVASNLLEGFNNGQIAFNPNAKTPAKKYAPGLVSNWIDKDEFFDVG